ncbi:MAG: ornithine carbamoyltransferase [Deltaproteobacteria bacterium]|nr:ornithine carbamoyltransferase [Deltaproteobacteria bacterium]MBW1872376.1 ornithine carbamoyltransferase [Deltaproteobacteria bacterium]
MTVSLKGKHLVSLHDFTSEEITQILDSADLLKLRYRQGDEFLPLTGKTLAMVFQKPSLRTRMSFEAGMHRYGGHAIYLGPSDIALGKRESTPDIARNLDRFADAIMARVFQHKDVVDLAEYSAVPVINGLSDRLHPCQILADLLTIREKFGRLTGLKLAFLGDGNNVAHSLLYGCAKIGLSVSLAVPEGFDPDQQILEEAKQDAKKTGAELSVTHDLKQALADANIVYTDVWASMGQEDEKAKRAKVMQPYQLNSKALSMAPEQAIVLHCLPAHRGEEITDRVIDGPQSVVFDQAENRLHAQMSFLVQAI